MLQLLTDAAAQSVRQAALDIQARLARGGAQVHVSPRTAGLPAEFVHWTLEQAPRQVSLSDVSGRSTWSQPGGPGVPWTGNISGSERALCNLAYTCLSRLHWSATALEASVGSSGHGLPVIVDTEPMVGGTTPVALLGTVLQATGDALSGISILQLLEPGRPTVCSVGFAHALDMRSATVLPGSV